MSRLSGRGRARRALLAMTAAVGLVVGLIPAVAATAPATLMSVDRTEVVVGAARLFTFTYVGTGSTTGYLQVPERFSAPATGADKSTGTILGVGWVAGSGGVAISSLADHRINLTLTGPGTLRYFGRTSATGRNEFVLSVGGLRGRAVPVWGRPAKISVVMDPTKKVASTTGTMAATALVTDVSGVRQDKVVLYFSTTLPGGTVFTGERDNVTGCSDSGTDGVVCTGVDGTAGVVFKTGTDAGCYYATARNRAWRSSYYGSAAFSVWPADWVRDSSHVKLYERITWLVSGTDREVKVVAYDQWWNRANLTSGDKAWLEKSSGTGTVAIGSAEYAGAGSCWGTSVALDVTGETAGTVVLKGGLLSTTTPKLVAGNLGTFWVVPGTASTVEVTTGTSPTHAMTMEYIDDSAGVQIRAWDASGNRICFKSSSDYSARNAHLGPTTAVLSFDAATYTGTCPWSWLDTLGYRSQANVKVISETDGTYTGLVDLYGYVNDRSSGTGTSWPYITVTW